MAAGWLPSATTESSIAWIARLTSGPAPAIWEALSGAIDWTSGLAGSLGIGGLMGLILLAIPLFAWLRRLMPDRIAAEESPAAQWGTGIGEGVVA